MCPPERSQQLSPASTALTSSLLWPPRAEQPWVCWRCCACWYHCQCCWVPCQPVALYQCNTSWFPQDSVAPKSPMAATPLLFNYPSVLRPWKCQVPKTVSNAAQRPHYYAVLQKLQWRTLSTFIHSFYSLKTPTRGTRDSLIVFPESPPTLPRLSHPQVDFSPTMWFGPCADTYRVVHHVPGYLSPCDGRDPPSWDPPPHMTTSNVTMGSSFRSPL